MPLDTLDFQHRRIAERHHHHPARPGRRARTTSFPSRSSWTCARSATSASCSRTRRCAPVTINGGMRMPAWYDILGADLVRREDETGLRESVVDVQALIDREIARGHAGVAHRAGRLLARLRDDAARRACARRSAWPAWWACRATCRWRPPPPPNAARPTATCRSSWATAASIRWCRIARGIATRDALVELGHPVEWHDYPMQHSVSQEEIERPARLAAEGAGRRLVSGVLPTNTHARNGSDRARFACACICGTGPR